MSEKVKLNEEQILELKEKHKTDVYELAVEVDDSGAEAIGYLKKPTRPQLAAAMSKMSKDPVQANEILLRSCLIPEVSDMRLVDNDDVFISAMSALEGLFVIRKAELKKI